MLIVSPPGWTLLSSGKFVRGGPILHALGSGVRLTTDGRIVLDGPQFDPGPAFPQFDQGPFLPSPGDAKP